MKECIRCGNDFQPTGKKSCKVCEDCKEENKKTISKNLKGNKGVSTPYYLR